MRTLIIYTSVHHGNTGKVAQAMAGALGADMADAAGAEPGLIDRYDLIGFGSGIYHGRHHQTLFRFVEMLPEVDGSLAFVFSTSGRGVAQDHTALKQVLEAKGFRIVGDFVCKGWDTYTVLGLVGGINKGRPDARDLAHAAEFADDLARQWGDAGR